MRMTNILSHDMDPHSPKWMKGKVLMKGYYIAFGNAIKENMFDELFEQ